MTSASELIQGALARLERDGWTKGFYMSEEDYSSCCVLGALHAENLQLLPCVVGTEAAWEAVHDAAEGENSGLELDAIILARHKIRRAVVAETEHDSIPEWNDDPATDFADVRSVLKKAADL